LVIGDGDEGEVEGIIEEGTDGGISSTIKAYLVGDIVGEDATGEGVRGILHIEGSHFDEGTLSVGYHDEGLLYLHINDGIIGEGVREGRLECTLDVEVGLVAGGESRYHSLA
jgi:hypothetical protein